MTALDQNFSDLANILMQRRQMQAQQVQQDRANRLSDLQFKQLQREEDYQTGLRNAMSNPGGSGVTLPQLQPPQPQQNTLASLGNQLPFPQPQASFAPVEAKMSPSRAGAEYALKQGKIEDAAKLINMDDALAQYAAKVQAGQGNAADYYKQKQGMDTYKQFVSEVTPLLKTPNGIKLAQNIAARYQQMDPEHNGEYDLSTMKVEGDKVVQQVKDPVTGALLGHMISAPDGSQHYQKLEVKQDKPFSREYDEGDTRVTELYDGSGKLTGTKRAPRYKPAATGASPDAKGDLEERKIALKELPALRKDAESAKQAYPRINRMLQIIDSGNAGGVSATLKQWLAPYAPESKSMNEAALFQTFARMVSGPQRVNIIGTGPQTEAEGRLLATVGGGGTQGRAALRELLNMHKEGYIAKRDEYNQMLANAKTKIYKPINFGDSPAPIVPAPAGGKDTRPPLSAIFGTKKR